MAVIGKIQKNSLLLLIVVGLAMLAFIFTDLRGNSRDVEQLPTATLNGDPIDEQEYEELRENYVNRSKNEYAYQQKEWDNSALRIAEDNAFNELIRRSLLNNEFERLGIVCTKAELNDMIHGDHLHPWVLQIPIFTGTNGIFSKDSVRNFITRLEVEPAGATAEERERWLEARSQWKDFELELENARKADKYIALIKKGLYVNKLEAQNQYNANYDKKQVRFVLQRYIDIDSSEVTLTEEDLKGYYEEHKNDSEYEQEEARDIQMVFFNVSPTSEDVEIIKSDLEKQKTAFAETVNVLGYVYQNSDSKFLSDSTKFRYNANGDRIAFSPQGGSYPKSMDEEIQASNVGDVLGPYMAFNSQTNKDEVAICRVIDLPTEKQAWVRHILISTGATRTEEKAKAIADSLIRVIKANDNFAQLVPQFSEDPGSIDNGGEYKWFPEGMMVPTFNDASFNGPIGQLQLVKTDYGYHIVEVLGQADRKVPVLAIVTKEIKASEESIRIVEQRAFDFKYQIANLDGDSTFSRVANDSNMTVQSTRIFLSNDYVLGMKDSDKMLRFAFKRTALDGDISDPMLDGDKYVVAYIENLIPEGLPEYDDVKEIMRKPALMEKQAEVYMTKMAGKNSLEDVGKVISNGGIGSAEITFDSKSIYNGGSPEPAVIGALFRAIPVGSMTVPIKGEEGVYVFIVDNDIPANETTDLTNIAQPMILKRVSSTDNRVIQALREKADLQDNRRKIRYQ